MQQPIELDAEELFLQFQQFSQRNFQAMRQNKWEDFAKSRKELDSWFLARGIRLTSKD